jgi:hypothetical protein
MRIGSGFAPLETGQPAFKQTGINTRLQSLQANEIDL